ncbi:MAG: inorganic phosphate transporter [Paracoccus sp. (in: a-proteobacteria)]|uniref:inorganic phosphate transporter n=1 Tax=Paracoccus sp. TaxID=267 RepID=UPI00391AB702
MTDKGRFRTLDKDLGRITHAEVAQMHAFRPVWWLGLMVLAAVALIVLVVGMSEADAAMVGLGAGLIVAAWLGLAIGSNDVANSLGPAVGAGAIGLLPGLALVALAEVAGAVLAGGAVSQRLAGGIVDTAQLASGGVGALVMLSALIGAASWITLASGIGLPVSTSHSIVGGIAGAGAAALGLSGVAWGTVGMIASAWVVAPVLAGCLAGGLVIFLRHKIMEREDRGAGARLWLPPLVAVMCALFAAYVMVLLGRPGGPVGGVVVVALAAGGLGWASTRIGVDRERARHDKPSAKRLLRPALVVSVVIMGFAHGANDVGNVAGPLSVIIGTADAGGGYGAVPMAALLAAGMTIALGTLLFGGRVVVMVGGGITRLNAGRAFCVTLATAMVVIAASGSGLPVSTTHVAVGGVFGVGFAREWQDRRRARARAALPEEEQSRRRLIRRSHVATITAAWAVTLPVTAALGAMACWLMLRLAG